MKKHMIIISFMFMVTIVGCTLSTASPYPSEQGIPYPSNRGTSSRGHSAFHNIIPTPLPNTGTIIGQIVDTTGRSPAGIMLYLAPLLPLTPGPGYFVTIDPQHSSKTNVLDEGRFIIANAPSGKYVLILWTPHDSRFVPQPDNPGKELIVTVIAGQIIDIGTVTVSLPR